MKCSEIVPPFKCYQVSVRLKSGMSGRTLVFAENPVFARDLAISLYGNKNLISVVVSEDTNESQTTNKTLDPDQQRIKALSNQKKQISQQLKSVRSQSKLKKAQQAMQSLRSTKPLTPS
jgi:hypothetical protein